MAWVRIHDGAMTHPKIVELTDKAFRLWVWGLAYSQQHLTDGRIPQAAVPARLKRACDDLVQWRLWDASDRDGTALVGSWQVHDYLEWNDSRDRVREKQTYAKRRLEDWRDKQAEARAGRGSVKRVSNASLQRVGNATTETLLKPNLTKPNQEEKKEICAEPVPDSTPFATFPVVGPGAPHWSLAVQQVEKWQGQFPNLDIRGEVVKALAWTEANPTRRKTAKGMPAFLVRWFSSTTNRGGGQGTGLAIVPAMGKLSSRMAAAIANARREEGS